MRDLTRILALLSKSRSALLDPLLTDERRIAVQRISGRRDIGRLLGLNADDASRFIRTIRDNCAALPERGEEPDHGSTL